MGSSSTPARRLLLLLVVAITSSTIAKAQKVGCNSGNSGYLMKGTSAEVNFFNAFGKNFKPVSLSLHLALPLPTSPSPPLAQRILFHF